MRRSLDWMASEAEARMRGRTRTSCAPYALTNSGPFRREFCMTSFARYTKSSWRDADARRASVAQTLADSTQDFLWYCTQCESVWIDDAWSFSFESFPTNESFENPDIRCCVVVHRQTRHGTGRRIMPDRQCDYGTHAHERSQTSTDDQICGLWRGGDWRVNQATNTTSINGSS
jgi:hypothetical protein